MATRKRPSRSQRNQTKWDNHAATQKKNSERSQELAGLGAYAGGKPPVFASGSVSPVPRQPTVTQRKGISLKVFTDIIPGSPGDWTDGRSRDTVAASPAVLKPHWSSSMVHRQAFDSERGAVRPSYEARPMAADRVSGGVEFMTYAERHESDAKAGLYRDGMGRVMRTVDMDDSMTTGDYAKMHGVPVVRTRDDQRNEAAGIRNAERAAKASEREARRIQREQEKADRIQRRLDRAAGKSDAATVTRREMDEAARAVLKSHGVTNPTKIQMQAAREAIAHAKQVQAYTGDAK